MINSVLYIIHDLKPKTLQIPNSVCKFGLGEFYLHRNPSDNPHGINHFAWAYEEFGFDPVSGVVEKFVWCRVYTYEK